MLAQPEVDEFMAAEKVVPSVGQVMHWTTPVESKSLWRGSVEVDAHRVGEIIVSACPALPRAWHFKLCFHGDEVYRIDSASGPCRHSNPRNRHASFPGKVSDIVHEHIYVEGLDCKCARGLPDLAASGHDAIFEEFCTRARLRFEPEYRPPQTFHQIPML